MAIADRTLTVDVSDPPDPVDLTVLPLCFNEVLQDLPWWNRDWKVSHVEAGLPFVAKVGFG
ncbi:hypothetical protein [Streptomyces virginiae]